jgi:PKD domain
LWHEFRNDRNFNGDLMGNGLRGWRGSLFPQFYPGDNTHLSTASALVLNYSRFFNAEQSFTDDQNPGAFFKSATEVPENGLCGLGYRAFDSSLNTSLLGGVLLIRAGQVVADIPLNELNERLVDGKIYTYDYAPGVEDEWSMLVTDRQGNRHASPGERITCEGGHNRAPQPQIEVITTKVETGEEVLLDAVRSIDPDGSWINLTVRWDVDGDGSFDTDATTDKAHRTTYTEPGIYQVVAELTDEIGDSSVSVPIGIRVERHEFPVSIDIKPGDAQNSINPRAKGGIWVAVLSDGYFDPLRIDVASVRFGPGEAAAIGYETWDFNGDGASDLALRFRISESAIRCGQTEATLAGATIEGQSFAATDSIKTVGCKKQ